QTEGQIPIDCGLPGRVRAARQIVTSRAQNRLQAARSSALAQEHDAIAVPVVVHSQIEAVLVFYGNVGGPHELPLNRLLTSVADKLAHLVGRDSLTAALAKAEESLRQTQKMEAIGLLAGGIAHDFNNLLTLILGNVELLLVGYIEGDRVAESLHEIQAAGEQGASLTRQLLTFSRKRPRELELLYPAQVLSEMQRMLQRVAGKTVAVDAQLAQDTHPVRMDRVEFEQVMLNLTANARDAMPAGGTLTISVANAFLGLKEISSYPEVRPGDFAVLTVADTGCGMDETTQARAFEPFFTTKNVDRGTGLGLATVYGIVRDCGGFIEIASTLGAGTRFSIFLPRAPVGIRSRPSDEQPIPIPRGTETVVVVEDEDVLRNLVQRILEVHGYHVHSCSSGFEALDLLRETANDVDLLLTDVVMPHMNGPDLVQAANQIRPELPAMLMSGYPSLADQPEAESQIATDLLTKPFTSEGLARAVRLDPG
ncbi:MAG: response regulator, partial [Planctomycetaceae bacterium]